jgi:ABC-type phosphate transport system substrate-binding protein
MTKIHWALLLLGAVSLQAPAQVVVIANKDAPVEKIERDQATQIFLKQVQSWPDGSAILPVDIREGSPLRAEFYSKITGRSVAQVRSYWARQAFTGMGFPPKQVASAEDVTKAVQSTPGSIGYVARKEGETGVKILLEVSK